VALSVLKSLRSPVLSPLGGLAALAGLIVALPLAGVVFAALDGATAEIATQDLARYARTTAILSIAVGVSTAVLGSIAAWLVVMHQFPGRDVFAWALALPLAMPAFAVAYGYADMFDAAGALRTWLRAATGNDLPFEMRSIGGAVFVLSAAFYPYVYLSMRAAFLGQSGNALEAARMLGSNGSGAFLKVGLPMARPALAAGVALAVMETLADYGAVYFLSVQTLTTGVVRAWSVYGSTTSAARFALPLLAAAALLMWFERSSRNGRSYDSARTRWRGIARRPLSPKAGVLAFTFCLALLSAGLLIPAGWLAASLRPHTVDWGRLIDAVGNSFGIGLAGAALTIFLATMLALGARRLPLAARLASLGYATPGAVMAIGLLAPASVVWALAPGSGMGIALVLLALAYAARLMAAALEPIDAGLTRVSPSMLHAARTLGQSELRSAFSVELPMARGAMMTAGLIIFVDILKELPATLILRPFNFDTLAVIANNYASDERLEQASLPSLLILCLSLPAVLLLTRQINTAAPGEGRA
jgi:iron(III) transport system permease protein